MVPCDQLEKQGIVAIKVTLMDQRPKKRNKTIDTLLRESSRATVCR